VNRVFELLLPMGGLFGVSIYKSAIETPDGYRDEPVDPYSLPWKWHVSVKTYACVRATKLQGPMRILASPVGEGASAYDVPPTMMLVHDLGRIWAMDPMDFQTEYRPADILVQTAPDGTVGFAVLQQPK
jgi:hypothetical protein